MDGNAFLGQTLFRTQPHEGVSSMSPELASLNDAPRPEAVRLMTTLVERSAWVAEAALDARPFHSDEALTAALVEIILDATPARRLALFNAHPELGGRDAKTGQMTLASTGEQGRLGLHLLTGEEASRLSQLNEDYRKRFKHPFIIALHRIPERAALFELFQSRSKASAIEEHVTTLAEITSVIRSRSRAAFGLPNLTVPFN